MFVADVLEKIIPAIVGDAVPTLPSLPGLIDLVGGSSVEGLTAAAKNTVSSAGDKGFDAVVGYVVDSDRLRAPVLHSLNAVGFTIEKSLNATSFIAEKGLQGFGAVSQNGLSLASRIVPFFGGRAAAQASSIAEADPIIAKDVFVPATTEIGSKSVIGAGTSLGEHVTIGPNSIMLGESKIGNFATVGAGSRLGFDVSIGRSATLGDGVMVRDGVKLPAEKTVPSYTEVYKGRFGITRYKSLY